MKNRPMEMQFKALDYMEKTYGKNWEERLKMSSPAITNAFIDGYMTKENEDKTAVKMLVSRGRFELDNLHTIGDIFGIQIKAFEKMPDHLGAMVDGEGNILNFIEFKNKI